MAKALLIIDIQRDYFPGGAYPLVAPEAAAEAAAKVLAAFRDKGLDVVHVQHVWDDPEATFMRPGTDGVEIHPLVAPLADETVVQKAEPNAFVGTSLRDELTARGVDELVVAGMMTSMCVDSTVRAAAELGYDVTVVHDACAAPDLEFGGVTVPGAAVHGAFLAALADSFAVVGSSADVVAAM